MSLVRGQSDDAIPLGPPRFCPTWRPFLILDNAGIKFGQVLHFGLRAATDGEES